MRGAGAGLLAAIMGLALTGAAAPARAATTIQVTTTADLAAPCSGAVSLRCAILQANADGAGDLIGFQIPAADPGCTGTPAVCTIRPASALPVLSASATTIDGYTQAGAAPNTNGVTAGNNARLTVRLDGSGAGIGVDGLVLSGAGDTVRGLSITGYLLCFTCSGNPGQQSGGSAVVIESTGDAVTGSFIGLMPDGRTAAPNEFAAVHVTGSGGSATVGGLTADAANVLSGNKQCAGGDCEGFGVYVETGSGTAIERNYVGVDASGLSSLPNAATGIVVLSGGNRIGSGTAAGANVISSNGGDGVLLGGAGTVVAGNLVGLNARGSLGLGNHSHGLDVQSSDNRFLNNVVSDNGDTGVVILGSGNLLRGNRVGTNLGGTVAIGNGFRPSGNLFGQLINGTDGIVVCVGGNTIGGATAGMGNLVSGNAGDGISLVSSGNLLLGNLVGTSADGKHPLGNRIDGIGSQPMIFKGTGFCLQAPQQGGANNTIGGSASGAGNVVSANAGNGLNLFATTASSVQGNRVGTDAGGALALGNQRSGIFLGSGASGDLVGGTGAGTGNVIAFNGSSGVAIGTSASDAATHVALEANSIFSNAGLGIDLAPAGGIDCSKSPPGPNDYTHCPVVASASTALVTGTACAGCRVEVFLAAADAGDQGHGEGPTLLGAATAAGDGSWSLSLAPGQVSPGQLVTATATAAAPAETSEFAANLAIS